MQTERCSFYDPQLIFREAEIKMQQLKAENKRADYFSFVPDGEPTLDINLGRAIELIKPLGIPSAVITNASLLWMDSVKEDLMKADLVSVSIDSADEEIWRKADRPHGLLKHEDILKGILDFSKVFKGTLVTETMLMENVNDDEECIKKIAEQLAAINPDKVCLLVPVRPPAESNVKRPPSDRLERAAGIIRALSGADIQYITDDEKEDGFFFTDDISEDILNISAVHPIREDIIDRLLKKKNADRSLLSDLLDQGKLGAFFYEGKKFYKKL